MNVVFGAFQFASIPMQLEAFRPDSSCTTRSEIGNLASLISMPLLPIITFIHLIIAIVIVIDSISIESKRCSNS